MRYGQCLLQQNLPQDDVAKQDKWAQPPDVPDAARRIVPPGCQTSKGFRTVRTELDNLRGLYARFLKNQGMGT